MTREILFPFFSSQPGPWNGWVHSPKRRCAKRAVLLRETKFRHTTSQELNIYPLFSLTSLSYNKAIKDNNSGTEATFRFLNMLPFIFFIFSSPLFLLQKPQRMLRFLYFLKILEPFQPSPPQCAHWGTSPRGRGKWLPHVFPSLKSSNHGLGSPFGRAGKNR